MVLARNEYANWNGKEKLKMLKFNLATRGWQWVLGLGFGLLFFVIFSAFYGLWAYLRPPKILSTTTPQDWGVEYEELILTTKDGYKLAAWFVLSPKKTDTAVILLHGYPADKGDVLPSTIFLREDYNLLYLDFRYFGQSQGRYSTIGIKEVQDVRAAIDYLAQRGVQKVGLWGFSMGGAVGLMSLARSELVAAVVADSSYASLPLMAEEVYRIVPGLNKIIAKLMTQLVQRFLRLDLISDSPLTAVSQSKKPILLIHSRDDKVIPFGQAELLQKALSKNPQAEFWFRDDTLHGEAGSVEYQRRLKEFFAKYLL